jgi:phosphinothricin acetyltransferase
MSTVSIRPTTRADLARLIEIYNYYIINTAITFDLEPYTIATRTPWFEEHTGGARHQMLVAVENEIVIGYACTGRFRDKAAYDPTVEASIYCAPEATGRGIGARLYTALFELLAGEDVHRIVAGVTIPNDASIALHQRFGFREIGTFSEVGFKFGRRWDVTWLERPLKIAAT